MSFPDAVQRAAFAAWCAADPGPSFLELTGTGSAEQRKERCAASGTRRVRERYAVARSGNTASILVFSVAALNGLTM